VTIVGKTLEHPRARCMWRVHVSLAPDRRGPRRVDRSFGRPVRCRQSSPGTTLTRSVRSRRKCTCLAYKAPPTESTPAPCPRTSASLPKCSRTTASLAGSHSHPETGHGRSAPATRPRRRGDRRRGQRRPPLKDACIATLVAVGLNQPPHITHPQILRLTRRRVQT